jgi:hypothetical protein
MHETLDPERMSPPPPQVPLSDILCGRPPAHRVGVKGAGDPDAVSGCRRWTASERPRSPDLGANEAGERLGGLLELDFGLVITLAGGVSFACLTNIRL